MSIAAIRTPHGYLGDSGGTLLINFMITFSLGIRNLAALRGNLKDDAPTVCADAAVRGNTISITGFVENQAAAIRIRSGVALKDMQEALGPASVHVRCQLEDRAATTPTLADQVAAVCGRAVKISCSVKGEASERKGSISR